MGKLHLYVKKLSFLQESKFNNKKIHNNEMNLLSLLGVEMAFSGGRRKGTIKQFDTEVQHYENKEQVLRNSEKFGKSKHWTIDSQFWG